MIIDKECPRCNGIGEVHTATPSQRSRYVRYDDLSPDEAKAKTNQSHVERIDALLKQNEVG